MHKNCFSVTLLSFLHFEHCPGHNSETTRHQQETLYVDKHIIEKSAVINSSLNKF